MIFQCNYLQIEKLPAWLGPVSSDSQSYGLAFGDSIYGNTWDKYIKTNTEDTQVISDFAERFQKNF